MMRKIINVVAGTRESAAKILYPERLVMTVMSHAGSWGSKGLCRAVLLMRDGGRLVIPVGDDVQELRLLTRRGGSFEERRLLPVRFVPLVAPPS